MPLARRVAAAPEAEEARIGTEGGREVLDEDDDGVCVAYAGLDFGDDEAGVEMQMGQKLGSIFALS